MKLKFNILILMSANFVFGYSQVDSLNCFEYNSNRVKTIEELKILNYLDGCEVPSFSATSIYNDSLTIPNIAKPYTFLVFWFLSCPPCLTEVPHLIELQDRYKENLQIIGVTFEKKDDVLKFITNHNINYSIISDASNIIDKYILNGYPKNFLIDENGKILLMTRGFVNENDDKLVSLNLILSDKN